MEYVSEAIDNCCEEVSTTNEKKNERPQQM